MTSPARPVLLNSCAMATTAAEARFRIDVPLAPSRATRVVALDPGAEETVIRASQEQWHHALFYTVAFDVDAPATGPEGLEVVTPDGTTRGLVGELEGVDVAVMVASSDAGAAAASTIGAACTVRGIMTAGLVLIGNGNVSAALSALRPHARVLMVPADESDLVELLRAIRA
jgi:hypothetical protein